MKERDCSFSVKGKRVVGTLCIPDSEKKAPLVLLIHGFTGNRHESVSKSAPLGKFSLLSAKLAQAGIASFRIDMRGSGESDGKFEEMTAFTELEDTIAACDYLKHCEDVDGERISVLGLSFGGLIASVMSGMDKMKIRSLVLWNPAPNMMQVMMTIAGADAVQKACADENEIYELELWDSKRRLCGKFFTSLCQLSAHAGLQKYKGPLLVEIGLKDHVVWPEPAQAQGLIAYHEGKHELFSVNGSHDFTDDGDDAPLISVIEKAVAFFKTHA